MMNRIIIAGGNGLIGSALVKAFKERGAEVICADIRGEGEYFNMAEPATLQTIFKDNYPVDGFVNCTYPRDLKTATSGWLACTEIAAKELSVNGGSIVNFGSIYGMVGSQMDLYDGTDMTMPTEYSFVKGGIIAASRDIATKYAKHGVRCNVVSPGGVWNHQPQLFVRRYEKRCPMGRMAVPEDLIELVWMLINQGSEYISGVCIPVDGGWTAW